MMKEVHEQLAAEEVEKDNIINLAEHQKLAMTGPQPADKGPEGPNWLKDLEVGTTFLVHGKKDNFVVEVAEAFVKSQFPKSTLLTFHMPTHSFDMWVNPENYSKVYILWEIVRLPKKEKQ